MNAFARFSVAALLATTACFGSLVASDWPGFRGPKGSGASDDKDVPAKWTKDNFLWKVKLPGPGTSSPIITGDKVIVTCYTGYGMSQGKTVAKGGFGDKGGFGKGGFGKGGFGGGADAEQKKLRFQVLCFDRNTGTKLWQTEVAPKLPEASFNSMVSEHGYATNSPATDGERVFAFFGKTGVLAFDLNGKQLWQADVGTQTHMHGTAASLVLHKDLVIVNAAIESQSLVALNKITGKEVSRTRGLGTTWASPLIVETKEGKHEVVMNLLGTVKGYDPATGKELWKCQGIGSGGMGGGFGDKSGKGGFGGAGGILGSSTTPVAQNGVVYVIGGGGPGGPATAMAIKTGGKGDVTQTHVLWKQKAGAQFCSPVVNGNFVYWIDGIANCLRADTGKVAYKERLYSSRGEYASAVLAGDKIFALTRFDGLYVLAAGEKFQKLAHHDFTGDSSNFNSSPAVSEGRLLVRSNEYLYCIGKVQ